MYTRQNWGVYDRPFESGPNIFVNSLTRAFGEAGIEPVVGSVGDSFDTPSLKR